MSECRFCQVAATASFDGETFGTVAVFRSIPGVNNNHLLVVPKEHRETALDLTTEEWADTHRALTHWSQILNFDGLTLGWNVGWAGGQTVMHAHFHIVPRFVGDVSDPRGGILHAIRGNDVLKSFVEVVK